MAEVNYYGLTGGVQKSQLHAVLPVDFAAVADDFETVTLTWDETDAVCNFLEVQTSEGVVGEGTVTTLDDSDLVVGSGTNFDDFSEGQLIHIEDDGIFTIVEIIDAENMRVEPIPSNSADTLGWEVSGEWEVLANLPVEGIETVEHSDLTAETPYFYRMRGKRRMWWSGYESFATVTTPAEL